jgi:hypothetical protein
MEGVSYKWFTSSALRGDPPTTPPSNDPIDSRAETEASKRLRFTPLTDLVPLAVDGLVARGALGAAAAGSEGVEGEGVLCREQQSPVVVAGVVTNGCMGMYGDIPGHAGIGMPHIACWKHACCCSCSVVECFARLAAESPSSVWEQEQVGYGAAPPKNGNGMPGYMAPYGIIPGGKYGIPM